MAPWTKEELAIVVQLVEEHGPKWKTIGLELEERLPGRNIAQTRNAFLRMVQGQSALAKGGAQKNKCKVCGEPKLGHICGGHQYGELKEIVARKSNRKYKVRSERAARSSFSIHSPEGAPMSPQSCTSATKTANMSSNNSTAGVSDVVNQAGNDSDDDFASV